MTNPGLCRTCASGRSIKSGRGSVFWRCAEHDRDRRMPKYPPLPVLRCALYRPVEPNATG